MRVPAHAAVSATVDARPRRRRRRAGRLRRTPCCAGSRDRDLDALAAPQVAPDGGPTPTDTSRVVHSHPRWIVRALRDALAFAAARRRRARRRCSPPTTTPPAVTLVARARAARPPRSCRRPRAARPGAGRRTPCGSRPAGDPGRARRGRARAGPACRTRAASWSRSRWPPRPLDGPDARGGSTSAPVPAARRRCSPRCAARRGGAAPGRERASAAPRRPRSVAARRRVAAGLVEVRVGDGRPAGEDEPAATTACSSTPPAPAWARCGGVRRPGGGGARGPGRPRRRCSATCCASALRGRPAGRGGRLRRPARRTPPRPGSWSTTCCAGAPTSSGSTPAPLLPGVAGRSATAPTSSCGRTGTAPTRCTWPCSAVGSEQLGADHAIPLIMQLYAGSVDSRDPRRLIRIA